MRIKEMSLENRPLERLILLGPESLSQAELLAIIIKTGTKEHNVLDICQELCSKYKLKEFSNLSIAEITKIKGIGKIKAAQIKSVFEISKRIMFREHGILRSPEKITSPKEAFEYIFPKFLDCKQEKLIAVFISPRNEVISCKVLTTGTSNQTLISSKDIVLWAIREEASGIIVAHNHPTGVCEPSTDDKISTEQLNKAAKLMDVSLIDHLIVTENGYFSFKESGLL
ncbi:MAG: DNA repair protein RadC [archaeon]|jgi:DNA repair protein RadC